MASYGNKVPPSNQDAIFSGSIECNGRERETYLSVPLLLLPKDVLRFFT
jgi:hypothetical protein